MKTVLIVAIAAGSLAVAQTVVPVEKEPHHRLVFENAYLNVLDVTFPPGEFSLFHQHSRDNVAIRMTGGRMRVDQLAGEGTPRDDKAGSVVFNAGTVPYTHRVGNIGTSTVRIVDVELVGGKVIPSERASDESANHVIAFENERVRVSRIRLLPGESLSPHTHQRGWLEVVVAGHNPGHFGWHGGGERVAAVTRAATPIEIVEVEPK